MSKMFSISLATVLMLINIVGPMQPTYVMEDVPQEITPLAEETPAEELPGGEDAIVDVGEETLPHSTENDEVVSTDEALTPVEEPAKNANSPPTEDELIDEDDTLVSPSAVDPNPGDCPVGEICDGGGGGSPVTITTEIWVSDIMTSAFITTATVVVKDEQGTVIGTHSTSDGSIYLELVAGSNYTADVTAPGYNDVTGHAIKPTASSTFFAIRLYAPPQVVQGPVTFEVVNAQTQQPLPDAEISIVFDLTRSPADSGTTDSVGTWTSKELTEGTYWASVSAGDDFHGQYDIPVTIPASSALRVELQPVSRSPISLQFVDATTGEPVAGAQFSLRLDNRGTDVEDYASASGEFTTEPLEHGNYGLDAYAEGYGYVIDFRFNHPANGTVVIGLQPLAPGTVTFQLVNDSTGAPLPNAYVTIFEGNFGDEVAMAQTDANGEWTTPELSGDFYSAAMYPVDHYSVSFTFSVVSGNSTMLLEFEEFNDVGYLNVHVTDDILGKDVENAKITVRENGMGVVGSGHTGEDGTWTLQQLPAGHYIITVERHGYFTEVIELRRHNAGDDFLEIGLRNRGQHDVRFWLRLPKLTHPDWSTHLAQPGFGTNGGLMPIAFQTADEYQPVVGANVLLVDADSLQVVIQTTSDENGLVELGNVMEGDYILQIFGEGFEDYSEPFSVTEEMEFELNLTPSQATNPDDNEGEPGDDNADPEPSNPDDDDEDNDSGTPTNPDDGDENTDPDSNTPDSGSNPDTGNDDIDETTTPDGDDTASTSDENAVVQSAGSSTDAPSSSVNQLPNTGIGDSKPNVVFAALTLVAGFFLLGALGVRRSTR